MKKRRISAEELMTELSSDAGFLAMRERQDKELRKNEVEDRAAEVPLLRALKSRGFDVASVWDLLERSDYDDALPVLLQHLEFSYPAVVRDGIARALGVPATKALGWAVLLKCYEKETDKRVRDGIAVAIAAAADDEVLSDVIHLLRDPNNGSSRLLLIRALADSRAPNAYRALVELQSDPELSHEIGVLLRRKRRKR